MRGFKETNKISWNESKYKKALNDDEKKIFKSLTREQKDTAVIAYLNGKSINLMYPELHEVLRQTEIEQLGYDPKEKEAEDLRKFELRQQKIEERQQEMLKETEQKQQEKEQNQYEKITTFLLKQGIKNPTKTTTEAFKQQQIYANFDNFYHTIGKITLDMEKQAQFHYYMTQQKQTFINIAQQDKLIKQNEEIIQLLKAIADK